MCDQNKNIYHAGMHVLVTTKVYYLLFQLHPSQTGVVARPIKV